MSADPSVKSLAERLDRAATPDEARAVLSAIAQCPRSHAEATTLGALEERAIGYLREATQGHPEAASVILEVDILPRCLTQADGGGRDPWPNYREMFGGWLDHLPFEYQDRVRGASLARAVAQLDTEHVTVALRLIARVGLADIQVCARLDDLYPRRPDETGDHALFVRTLLGTPPNIRDTVRTALHDRMRGRRNLWLSGVAQRVGDPETARLILEAWLQPGVEERQPGELFFFLGSLAAIISRHPAGGLPTKIWTHLRTAAAADRVLSEALDGGVVSRLPTPAVVTDLINRASRVSDRPRWLLYNRLEECVHPAHSDGWAAVGPAAAAAIRADATSRIASTGRWRTTEHDQKEGAWNVLLCVGDPGILPPLSNAFSSDLSGYTKHAFLDLVACLGLPPLPLDVVPILKGNAEQFQWSVDELLVAQIGAVRAAHGLASVDSFEALLGYRPARDGILISAIDAVAEVAAVQTQGGDRALVRRLVGRAEAGEESTTRALAVAALAELLAEGFLSDHEIARVASIAGDPTIDQYSRRALLYAFVDRPDVSTPEAVSSLAAELFRGEWHCPGEREDPALKTAALMLLAAHPDRSADAEFLKDHLGLLAVDGRIHLAHGPRPPATPHLIARWYREQASRLAPAAAALVRTADPHQLAPVLAAVQRLKGDNSADVIDALMERMHWMDAGRTAEPAVIRALAAAAPDRLVSDAWGPLDHWMPQARAALAAALGQPDATGVAPADRRRELLIRLAGDGLYGVRRAAHRSFAETEPTEFAALLMGWAASRGSEGAERRRRAAEAAEWIGDLPLPTVLGALEWDPEPTVRESFERAATLRQERAWREFHESRVLAAHEPGDVVPHWRHGWALAKLGDDRTIERLRSRSGERIPPNVRFWLERVRKGVQRRWDDVSRKWPEPWFVRRGAYEMAEGQIRWGDGTESAARLHLWLEPGQKPNEFAGWGGWAELVGVEEAHSWTLAFGPAGSADEVVLLTEGRQPTRILITHSELPKGHLVFSGNGPYPRRA